MASLIKIALDVLWYGALIFPGLLGCLFVVSLFLNDVNSDAYRVMSQSLPLESAQIRNVRAEVHFPVTKNGFFFGTLAGIVISLVLALWVLTQLRHVFGTLRDGRPFVAANATRIRWIGFAVIFGEIA